MIGKSDKIAVVGASRNSSKYGHIVLKDLISRGYDAVPINPHEEEILGKRVYHSLSDASFKFDWVIFIVPPEVGIRVIEEVKKN